MPRKKGQETEEEAPKEKKPVVRTPLTAGVESARRPLTYSALTIKPLWLAKILAGKKRWEIRRTPLPKKYLGKRVFLMASGTSRIYASAYIRASVCFKHEKLVTEHNTSKHQVDADALKEYCVKEEEVCRAFAWKLKDVQVFPARNAVYAARKGGQVNWVLVEDPQTKENLRQTSREARDVSREEAPYSEKKILKWVKADEKAARAATAARKRGA